MGENKINMPVYDRQGKRLNQKLQAYTESHEETLRLKRKANSTRYLNKKYALTECKHCKRPFSRKIARLQKENNREGNPICIPCILGLKRKELDKNGIPVDNKVYGNIHDKSQWGIK